nr:alpha/beta hydrolase [Ruegeria lacuscaerulensis]
MPKGKRSSLLWIHGYNTNLTDAVLRFAQFLEDTGYSGVPILYSWASQARLGAYVYDINSALIARDQLEEVPGLLKDSPVETIDIVAHSMGNLVAMEAARGIANRGLFNVSGKLRSVILASPDIDIDLFIAQLSAIPKDKRRFYVLTSENDQALAVSSLIARNPRVGQLDATLISELGLNVIDLSQVQDTTTVHHSKFADAPEVVRLIGDRILAGDKGAKVSGRAEAVVITASGTIAVVDEAISN